MNNIYNESSNIDKNLTQKQRAELLALEDGLTWKEVFKKNLEWTYLERACTAGGIPAREYHHDDYFKTEISHSKRQTRYWENINKK